MTTVTRTLTRLGRVAAALWRYAKAHCPKWLLPVLGVCLLIPGPLDEMLVLAVVMFPVLRSRQARRELTTAVRQAWDGPR